MSIETVRARLHDREVKAGARGTCESFIILDVETVEEVQRIETAIAVHVPKPSATPAVTPAVTGKRRLANPQPEESALEPDDEMLELERQLEAAEQAAREATLRLVFRSLGSTDYQKVLDAHPEVAETGRATTPFQTDLAAHCLWQVWEWDESVGQQQLEGLTYAELVERMTNGELETTNQQVLALNRRVPNAPFLPSSSPKMRS